MATVQDSNGTKLELLRSLDQQSVVVNISTSDEEAIGISLHFGLADSLGFCDALLQTHKEQQEFDKIVLAKAREIVQNLITQAQEIIDDPTVTSTSESYWHRQRRACQLLVPHLERVMNREFTCNLPWPGEFTIVPPEHSIRLATDLKELANTNQAAPLKLLPIFRPY